MVTKAPLFDLTRTLKILGIPVVRPTLKVIHGYLYINCKNIETGLAYIPSRFRLPELKQLLPPSVEAGAVPSPSLWRLISTSLRGLLLLILEPGINPFICLWLTDRRQEEISRQIDQVDGMPAGSPRETMNKIQAALETLSRLQIYNQWPYFFATFTTWVFRWLAVSRLNFSYDDFLNRISENGSNVTIDIERNFREMARNIAADSDIAARFMNEPVDQLATDLPPKIRTLLDRFISLYGCRSRHRTLFIKRWGESPFEVVGILQSLVRNQLKSSSELNNGKMSAIPSTISLSAALKNEREPSDPDGDSKKPAAADSPVFGMFLGLMTRLTRRFLDLREDLRFTLDRVLYQIRRTLLVLGDQTGLGDKIMFLNTDELEDIVTEKLTYGDARRKAAYRHNEFMRHFDVAAFFNDGRAEHEFQTRGTMIRGIGTSPGRIRGRARIVEDPSQANIQKGDIIIAKNTDPGWTPVLSIVGGMVMEEGGLLNHCSIVARELKVPSIVGVHRATQRIKDNDQITIDGGMGIVVIEE
jgi:pyruvate,water dikinase